VNGPHAMRPITRRGSRAAPLSAAQEGIWAAHVADPLAATYNVALAIACDGALDVAALRTAIDTLVVRHEVLRTRYGLRSGQPAQLIGEPEPVPLQVHTVDGPDALDQARAGIEAAARRPFALDRAAPVRFALWRGVPDGDLLSLCVHHIAIDGWSLPLLLDELWTCYDAALAGRSVELPAVELQYADFAAWERELHAAPDYQRLVAERAERLGDLPLRLRLGRPESAVPAGGPAGLGGHLSFSLTAQVSAAVRRVALRLRVTPYVVLLAAFEETVRRWSGERRFALATAMVNRPSAALERVVGCFVLSAPIRCDVRPERTFAELCRDVRREFVELLRYQGVPTEHLAARRPGVALSQVGFIVLNTTIVRRGRSTPMSTFAVPTGTAKSDLTLVIEPGETFVGTVEFDTASYARSVVEGITDTLCSLLSAAVFEPDTVLARLPIAPPGVRPGVLVGRCDDGFAAHVDRITGRRHD
jgi:hypothetical protein